MRKALSYMHCLQQLDGWSVHAALFVENPDEGMLLVALWPMVGECGPSGVQVVLGGLQQVGGQVA
jgi:hypothetical protein